MIDATVDTSKQPAAGGPLLDHRRIKCVECGSILASCDCPETACVRETIFVTCRYCSARRAGYNPRYCDAR